MTMTTTVCFPPITPNFLFFFSSRRRHTRLSGDWSSDVCSSDLYRLNSTLRRQRLRFKAFFLKKQGANTPRAPHPARSVTSVRGPSPASRSRRLREVVAEPLQSRAHAAQFVAVRPHQPAEHLLAVRGELDADAAPILRQRPAPHQPLLHQPVDHADRAVVLDQHPLRQLGDRDQRGTRVALDRQQRLVLLRGQAERRALLLAEMIELAQVGAGLRQHLEFAVLHRCAPRAGLPVVLRAPDSMPRLARNLLRVFESWPIHRTGIDSPMYRAGWRRLSADDRLLRRFRQAPDDTPRGIEPLVLVILGDS